MRRKTVAHPEMTALLKGMSVLQHKLCYWPDGVEEGGVVTQAYHGASEGEKCAIEFLLSVWDPEADWQKRGFRNFNMAVAAGLFGGKASPEVQTIIKWLESPLYP